MATNKRKDAAALFELIDRSTLKVPKNAGALKIPSWWSSKTNPPPNSTESAPVARPPSPQPRAPAVARTSTSSNSSTAEPSDRKFTPRPTPKPQSKLFEPPPADVEPGVSPSIRPPSGKTAAPLAPALKPPATPPEPADFKATEPISEQELPPDVPPIDTLDEKEPARPVFAPQSYAQDRKPWSPPRSGTFARLPAWVLLSGMAAVVILISIFVWAVKRTNTAAANPSSSQTHSTPAPTSGRSGIASLIPNASDPHTAGNPAARETPEPGRPGTVYEPGVTPHYAEQYYVVVCSTPSQSIAQKDAKWLADAGIDVSVERTTQASKGMFTVLTAQGFPSVMAAEPMRQQIVRIGDSHEKGAFAKAYTRNNLGPPASAPARRP